MIKILGIEIEINKRKKKDKSSKHNELISYSNISKILNKSYNTVKRKIKNKNLTVDEALKIFENINFKYKSKFDAFIYLFTEQEE